jgi:DNA polymerase-3 subunit alpha
MSRGQIGLFGSDESAVATAAAVVLNGEPIDAREVLAMEKEALGLYLSAHPLTDVINGRLPDGFVEIIQLEDRPVGQTVTLIASIKSVRRITTRASKIMAVVDLEDLTGHIELVLFPEVYEATSALLESDTIVEVVAKLDRRNEQFQLIGERISADITIAEQEIVRRRIILNLPQSRDYWRDVEIIQRLDALLDDHEGPDQIEFELDVDGERIRIVDRKHSVEWSEALSSEIELNIGAQRVRVIDPLAVA